MTVLSKPLVLTTDQQAAIERLQQTLRNPFERYSPASWRIEIHGMPAIAIHCLDVIRCLALEVGNYTMLSCEQSAHAGAIVSDTITFLSSMPLHQESLAHGTKT